MLFRSRRAQSVHQPATSEHTEPTFPFLLTRQVNEQSSRQSPENSIVKVEGPISRANDNDVVLGRLQTVHLLHELRDHAPMCDAATGISGYAGAEKGVQFVDEDDAWRELARK